ncbi:hypothetical protein F4678DRAFT_482887 [Xylaria arbuscula]|nr:hypothetical protein F4678DRAFT_482887 [Xylaria arbuscula]
MRAMPEEEDNIRLLEEFDEKESPWHASRKASVRLVAVQRGYIALLHLVIVALLVTVVVHVQQKDSRTNVEGVSWSPVQNSVQYELNGRHALKHYESSVYSGPPTSQQEEAWTKILTPMYFAATLQEMLKAGESPANGTQLNNGGYLATMGVYHELHCLHQMRLFLYRERYYHNITEKQEEYLHEHLDHCLEALRITIMCHGNTGLYTFAWESADEKPTTKSNARSACVKWSSIEEWSQLRQLGEADQVVKSSPIASM